MSITSPSLTNQYIISPPALCSLLCLSVVQGRTGPSDQSHSNTTTAAGWMAFCQTNTASHCPLRHWEPRETSNCFQRTKQIRQPSKRVQGGSFAGMMCKYLSDHAHSLTDTQTTKVYVHPSPDMKSLGLGTLTTKVKL